MRQLILGFTVLTLAVFSNCVAADAADTTGIDPVHTVMAEPGIVPPGTSLIVRTKETVNTAKAYKRTVYVANTAADVLDQNGAVLIPRESLVELVVRSVSYFGPGGEAMTILTLDMDAVVVRDVRYRVETANERPGFGGIGINRVGAKWIGGSEDGARRVFTRGQRIDVPTGTLLGFQLQAPLRLRGYQRQ